eukprot:8411079-Lingulodinium_polyedra.AAC.1
MAATSLRPVRSCEAAMHTSTATARWPARATAFETSAAPAKSSRKNGRASTRRWPVKAAAAAPTSRGPWAAGPRSAWRSSECLVCTVRAARRCASPF